MKPVYCFTLLFFLFLFSIANDNPKTEVVVTHKTDTLKSNPEQRTPISCLACDYIIKPKEYLVDNAELKLPPGSVLGLKGKNRKPIKLINFHGTAAKPFLIVNCDGQATITSGTVGIKIHKSSFLRVSGTGSKDKYGIKISAKLHGVQAENGATNYEVDHIEIAGANSIGFPARTNPDEQHNRDNFIQKNTLIHDNYIHDVNNEGIYVGGSHWQDEKRKEPELIGVRVYNNRVENAGYDGIQVGSAIKDSKIYNNVVINYGLRDATYHQSGIQVNPGTTGKIYNNYIEGGTGNAIFLTGFGNDVYNNVIVDCKKNAFYVADRSPLPNQSYRIVNNTMINVNGYALVINSDESENNIFYNNVMVNTAKIIDNMGNSQLAIKNNFETHGKKEELFTDPDNLDFSPLQNSPLIDAGLDINMSADINIEYDYLNRNRRSGEAVDIGAFEFQAGHE